MGEYIAPLILHDDPGQARVLDGLRHVILRIGREGRAVLVGRGANFLLDPAGGLRVRTVGLPPSAPKPSPGRKASPVAEARRRVAESDAAQRAFVRQAFQHEIGDPAGYDLVLSPLAAGPARGGSGRPRGGPRPSSASREIGGNQGRFPPFPPPRKSLVRPQYACR